MRFKSIVSRLCIFSAILFSAFFLTNCGCDISEEQLARIGELRREMSRVEDETKNAKREISKLESEVSARQKEAEKCEQDRKFIEDKLKNWPNVWPDWTPGQESEEEVQ